MDTSSELDRRVSAIAALDQPLRRRLYRLLTSGDWVSRDDAAEAIGVARSVAAFHLDKLVEAGVAEVRFERTSGRQGPGAGRPSKLYRLADDELSASIPERHYDLAGALLASAIDESTRTGEPVGECLHESAHSAGRRLGRRAGEVRADEREAGERRQALLDVLADHGYEPVVDRTAEIALANCPFHRLAEAHRELVCGMNLDFLEGLLEGMDESDRFTARLAPAPGCCCVRIADTSL